MIDVIQHLDALILGLGDVVEAPLPPRFRNIPDETVKARDRDRHLHGQVFVPPKGA